MYNIITVTMHHLKSFLTMSTQDHPQSE